MKQAFSKRLMAAAVFVAAATLTAGCATPFVPGAVPDGARALSGTEIAAITQRAVSQAWLFDNAFDGGVTYQLQANGSLRVTSRYVTSKIVMGSWRVDAVNSLLCTRIESGQEACSRMYEMTPDRRYYLAVEGSSLQDNTLTIRR
jgi:hypothetical protein